MARRLRTGAVLSAVVTAALVLPACSSGGAKQAVPPSTGASGTTSTTVTSSQSGRPATFVATLGTNPADLQVYSTTTGKLVRDLPISGVPAGMHPGQGPIYVSSRQEAFWPAITSGATETGSILEEPVGRGGGEGARRHRRDPEPGRIKASRGEARDPQRRGCHRPGHLRSRQRPDHSPP